MFDWSIGHHGGVVHIDDYTSMPTQGVVVCDIETNGREGNELEIVCIGITGNGVDCHVYFDLRPELVSYLQSVCLVGHDLKRAEIRWLERFGVTIDQAYFDTKTGLYALDSSRKRLGLKDAVKEFFGVEYPDYKQLVSTPEFIAEATGIPLVYDKKGKLKKPKPITLDVMPKYITAEYNACDLYWTWKLWQHLLKQMTPNKKAYFDTLEMPMTRMIYRMEREGIKIDTKAIRRIHGITSRKRRAAKRSLFESAGQAFNPNSPQQVLSVLQQAGVEVDATDEDTISRYSENLVVKNLLEYRGLQKVCSTYTIPLYFNAIKSPEERVYARFQQNTVTGRLSSSDPINLQNQPKEVREAFVARAGYSFINADWSNIELRLPAHFSAEAGFVDVLCAGGDIHTNTAKFIFGDGVEQAPDFKAKRGIAKEAMLTIANSGTAYSLANTLSCSKEEAEKFEKAVIQKYPVFVAWLKAEKRRACHLGGISSYFGRWVSLPNLKLQCDKPGVCGTRFNRYRTCRNCYLREEAERTAISVKVQGSASDMMKKAAMRLYDDYGLIPILNVHDELNIEVPDNEVKERVEQVRFVMENVVRLRVPLIADIGVGKNWKEAKQ